MTVPAETSRKVTVLSFVAMVCVVMIHSHAIGTVEHTAAWCVFLQTLLMRTATNWAVPFFFVVSGFFFAAHSLQQSTADGYGQLLRKKVRTLLLPYLLWAVIGTAISITLIMLNNHITHHGLFERTFMSEPGVWGKIDSLFGITRNGPRGNLALWYVHSLMWIFVLSPAMVAVARIHRMVLLLIGLFLVIAIPEMTIPVFSLKIGSVGWFCMGMGVAQLDLAARRMPSAAFGIVGICWLVLIVLGAMETAGYVQAISVSKSLASVTAIAGVLFWWELYDRRLVCKTGKLPECFRMTFWVYCLHGVVTGWILAPVGYLLGKSEWVAMLASFLSVCGSLVFCLVAGIFMKCRFPKIYAVLSGRR